MESISVGFTKISFTLGDITEHKVDAIVNAANTTLLGGAGVDGAIHSAAGPELREECKTLGGCDTGEAKITKGYRLPCKYVIHTVGPIYGNESRREPELLSNCYKNSLELAKTYGIKRIAFPSISTGYFGYPIQEAVKIAHDTVINYLSNNNFFTEIRFVLHSKSDLDIYELAFINK